MHHAPAYLRLHRKLLKPRLEAVYIHTIVYTGLSSLPVKNIWRKNKSCNQDPKSNNQNNAKGTKDLKVEGCCEVLRLSAITMIASFFNNRKPKIKTKRAPETKNIGLYLDPWTAPRPLHVEGLAEELRALRTRKALISFVYRVFLGPRGPLIQPSISVPSVRPPATISLSS